MLAVEPGGVEQPKPLEGEETSDDTLDYLSSIFQNADYKSVMQVHAQIQEVDRIQHKGTNARIKSVALINELRNFSSHSARQLSSVLSSPTLQGLLLAHDTISKKDYEPTLPTINMDSDSDMEDEPHVKLVRIYKSRQELGATLKRDERGSIIVGRIMHGSAADKSGLLQPFDEVKEINGTNVVGRSLDEVAHILHSSSGCLSFKIVPGRNNSLHSNDYESHLKANFEYNPNCDRTCPCPEAGLPFKRGEILKLISSDDQTWWQASLVSDPNHRTGLIPSREYQDRRISQSGTSEDSLSSHSTQSKDSAKKKQDRTLSFRRKKKLKKIMYSTAKSLERDSDIMHCYEEVYLHYPYPQNPRPIILVGAPGVGCDELRLHVIGNKCGMFASPIPHTTRSPKPQEVNGRDFIFVSRAEMERGIKNKQFIEHMEYRGHLYGTTFEAVEEVMRAGKSCVLHLQPQSVKKLRGSNLKPFVVLIKPPDLVRLQVTRRDPYLKSRLSGYKQFKDEELAAMIKVSQEIDRHFGPLIDTSLINDELAAGFRELLALIETVRSKPQWVPTAWG